MYQIVLVMLAAVSGSLSQLVVNGTCPITTGSISVFNYINIIGLWYQIERIPNSLESGDCSTTAFEGANIATTIVNREVVDNREVFNSGSITLRLTEPHRFDVTFSDGVPRDYYLIGTNFNGYALIGSCEQTISNNVTQTSVYAWKLSRNNTLAAADITAINQIINTIPSLAGASWRSTSHDNSSCLVINGAGSLASSLVMIVTALLFAAKENY